MQKQIVPQPLTSESEILGYQLIERIGSGGFGEVWSAIAPGGLKKAIKIVYGFHDGHRAQAELKALDRVKELRHPFLLSLERIEIHEGQLVVVSELADSCLADRFNEYVADGEPGIPREELLGFIRSSSEALDYLSDEHGLQHLDIKPENLLLTGYHVKVADFGLIKELHGASQSLMSGMTPAYAAPELFDGRPAKSSDQYSLAILYQEMLTGVRPFPGTTPAQLAAQHMHGKPNLAPLPHSDQSIIAKALSKDPSLRFKNCMEMADELSAQRRARKKVVLRRNPVARESDDVDSNTIHLNQGRDVTAILTGGLPFVGDKMQLVPGPELGSTDVSPTIMIGVGDTGNRIIQKVKSLLVSRHGSMDEIPAIKLLAIDTDRKSLGNLWRAGTSASLSHAEVLEIPLRKPEDYRKRMQKHLAWLSRRWIYNVPRSLLTEGLRPLGRLAFADHFEPICNRIQDLVREMTAEESLAKTADTLNMGPGALNPRIVIATSASGGIGSGMALDLAYTARLLSHECGRPADSVLGFLMHSTYQRYRDPGLSAANAFAMLTELRHYVDHGYPGDDSLGMPRFEDHPPFDMTYFDELGHDLCQSELEQKLDGVAEYLFSSTVSSNIAFFDECRKLDDENESFTLRTAGVGVAGPDNEHIRSATIQQIGKGLLRKWLESEPSSPSDSDDPTEELKSLGLDLDAVAREILSVADHFPELDLETAKIAGVKTAVSNPDKIGQQIDSLATQMFGSVDCDQAGDAPEHCLKLMDQVGILAQAAGENLSQNILERLNGPCLQLGAAKTQSQKLILLVDQAIKMLGRVQDAQVANIPLALQQLDAAPVQYAHENDQAEAQLAELVLNFLSQRKLRLSMRCQLLFLRTLSNAIMATDSLLGRFISQIAMIDNDLNARDSMSGIHEGSERFDFNQLIREHMDLARQDHIQATEQQVYEFLIASNDGYIRVLEDPSIWQGQLVAEIQAQAGRILTDHQKRVSLTKIALQENFNVSELAKWFTNIIESARPTIDDCGGQKRLLISVPELSEDKELVTQLLNSLNLQGTVTEATQGNIMVCYEGDRVGLPNVAYRLLQARPDAVELVKRIHTRNDINWVTLNDLL